jgi:predicted O-methyltransferase YrrM
VSYRMIQMTEALHQYLLDVTVREPEVLGRLRAETAPMPGAGMQISPDQGQLMQLLVRLVGARRAIEVGVFTGYSSLAVALALPADGKLVACDVNEEWTAIARRYWAQAGVDHKIELRLAPGVETLDRLLADGGAGTFDFFFIDADKEGYDDYYERCLRLSRPGGLIAVDNALWGGSVADESVTDADTVAIRALNAKVAHDERVTMSLLPVGDGLLLAQKRS